MSCPERQSLWSGIVNARHSQGKPGKQNISWNKNNNTRNMQKLYACIAHTSTKFTLDQKTDVINISKIIRISVIIEIYPISYRTQISATSFLLLVANFLGIPHVRTCVVCPQMITATVDKIPRPMSIFEFGFTELHEVIRQPTDLKDLCKSTGILKWAWKG